MTNKDLFLTQEKKRRRNILLLNIISALIIIGAIIWGIGIFFHLGSSVYTEDAQVEAYIVPINTRIPGYIKEIRFTEHQQVKKGDTLIIIDDREFQIARQQAGAQLADVEAARLSAGSGSDIAANSENVASANLDETKARLDNMETNFKRYSNLLQDDAVSRFQYDQVKADLDAMRARYQALRAQQRGSKLQTGETGDRIKSAEANIQKAKAMVNMANLNLSYTIIVAPYDGFVGRKTIEEGQLVQSGQPLVSIVRSNDKWVTANYTESQIAKLNIGQKVVITADAISHKIYHGKIAAISEATGSRYSSIPTDNATGNFVKVQQRIPVKIDFTQEDGLKDLELLRAGMNVQVKLTNK